MQRCTFGDFPNHAATGLPGECRGRVIETAVAVDISPIRVAARTDATTAIDTKAVRQRHFAEARQVGFVHVTIRACPLCEFQRRLPCGRS